MELDNTVYALLYLMRCALHNTPPEPVEGMDYEALYQLSASHSVVAMAAMALESGGLLTEAYTSADCVKKWRDAKVKAIRKNILLDAEREQIFRHFEEQGIWYLPLKGAVLKDMYPKMGMRQMADNDILFDPAYQHQVKAYMKSRGYTAVSFAKGNHDTYEKPPVYNFEFHTSLFNAYRQEEWAEYYQDIKLRLKKDAGNRFGYHFSDEDFYVYLLAHGYKHYSNCGTGIRFLSDIYVFLREKKACLNWDHLTRELRALNIHEFEAATRELADKLFGTEGYALTEEEGALLRYLMGAGTYGTMENMVHRELDKMQQGDGSMTWRIKFRYTWKRLFPNKQFMQAYSPFCRKYAWSIPFFWVYRLLRAAFLRRKAIRRELHVVSKA